MDYSDFLFKINRIFRKLGLVPAFVIKKRIDKYKSIYPNVMSIEDTLSLLNNGYSLGRFGDGEFNLCFNQSISFQTGDVELKKRLRFILKIGRDDKNKYIVGIPRLKYRGWTFWGKFWFFHVKQISHLLDGKIIYGDLGISRHIELFHIEELKKIWEQKNVLFVYGKNSKFNINHEIFETINNKFIIESSNYNAFNEVDRIIKNVTQKINYIDLILIALGPTASILAYEFCIQYKIQTIDIGHLTNVIDFKARGIKFKDG